MKKITLLVMLLLSFCITGFAESIDDVLKDCKLDRNRWKVAAWVKSEKMVRFYDSESVAVTGPNQFDMIIYDYFYGTDCGVEYCKHRRQKHYHSEKWGCDVKASTKTLKYFAELDANQNVVTSFEYPASLQIPLSVKNKSADEKTMLAVKELVKDEKRFSTTVFAEDIANSGSFVRGVPLTIEDLCIGGVYYGQPFSEVTKMYGKPIVTKEEGAPKVHFKHSFANNGTTFNVYTGGNYYTKEAGDVFSVVVSGNNGLATKRGIKFGSALAEIKEVYGVPTTISKNYGTNDSLVIYKTRVAFTAYNGRTEYKNYRLLFTLDSTNKVKSITYDMDFEDETR